MKAPVGLLSDRTVLRQQDGRALPRQVRRGISPKRKAAVSSPARRGETTALYFFRYSRGVMPKCFLDARLK